MNIVGIVAEYNPFHNGHLYQIEQIKKSKSRVAIIAIISGYYCQRGEPAIVSPRSRAKMALANGVDLVLQMPTYSASGSAEIFSSTAVQLLEHTGLCEYLAFGAEQDRLEDLSKIAKILVEQENDLWIFIKDQLKLGISYAAAREQFIIKETNIETAGLLKQANQILAIEYLKTIEKYKLKLRPYLIPRKGAGYLSQDLKSLPDNNFFASALSIRNQINKQAESTGFPANLIFSLSQVMPRKALAILLHDLAQHGPINMETFANLYYYNLETKPFAGTRYLNQVLYNRVQKEIRFTNDQYPEIETLVEKVTTKQLPTTRVKRALTNSLLNIKKTNNYKPSYLHVLGFNKTGRYLLRRMNKTANLPVISQFSKLNSVLSSENSWQADLELRAARIWLQQAGQPLNQLFESPLIV